MTLAAKSYRVLIWARGEAPPDSPDLTFDLADLAAVPTVGGQKAEPLAGRLVSAPYTVYVLGDDLTASFGSESRPALLGRVIRLQERVGAGAWVTLDTGRITAVGEPSGPGLWAVEVSDENWVGRRADIFGHSKALQLHPFGLAADFGPPSTRARSAGYDESLEVVEVSGSAVRLRTGGATHTPREMGAALISDMREDARLAAGNTEGNFKELRLEVTAVSTGGLPAAPLTVLALDQRLLSGEATPQRLLGAMWPGTAADDERTDDLRGISYIWVYWPSHSLSPGATATARLYWPDLGVPVSDRLPGHIGGTDGIHLGQLVLDILDGDHGGPPVRITAASRTAMETADLPRVWLRPTRTENRSEWLARNVFALFLILPMVDPEDGLKLLQLWTPGALDPGTLPLLDASVVADGYTWENVGREVVTRITAEWKSLIPDPKNAPHVDGLRQVPYQLSVDHDNQGELGVRELSLTTDLILESGAALNRLRWLARHIFDLYGDGAILRRLRAESITLSLAPGDLVRLDAEDLQVPNPVENDRLGIRIARVLEAATGPVDRELVLLDFGPALQPLAAPTVAIEQDGVDPGLANVTISNLPAGATAELEVGLSATTTQPAASDWLIGTAGLEAGTYSYRLNESGVYAHARARSRAVGRIPSGWAADYALLVTRPFISQAEILLLHATAYVRGLVNSDTARVRAQWLIHLPAEDPGALDPAINEDVQVEDFTAAQFVASAGAELGSTLGPEVEAALALGQVLTVDLYPYTAWPTGGTLGAIVRLSVRRLSPDNAPVLRPRMVIHPDLAALDVYVRVDSPVGEDCRLRLRGIEQQEDVEWRLVEEEKLPEVVPVLLDVASGAEVGPAGVWWLDPDDWWDPEVAEGDRVYYRTPFDAAPLRRKNPQRWWVQAVGRETGLTSGWVPLILDPNYLPEIASLQAQWDDESETVLAWVRPGPNTQSLTLELYPEGALSGEEGLFPDPLLANADGEGLTALPIEHSWPLGGISGLDFRGRAWTVRATGYDEPLNEEPDPPELGSSATPGYSAEVVVRIPAEALSQTVRVAGHQFFVKTDSLADGKLGLRVAVEYVDRVESLILDWYTPGEDISGNMTENVGASPAMIELDDEWPDDFDGCVQVTVQGFTAPDGSGDRVGGQIVLACWDGTLTLITVGRGGTGREELTAGGVVVGQGTEPVLVATGDADGQVLRWDTSGGAFWGEAAGIWELIVGDVPATGEEIGDGVALRLIEGSGVSLTLAPTPPAGEQQVTIGANLGTLTLAGMSDTAIGTVDDEQILMVIGGAWANVDQDSLSLPASVISAGNFTFDRLPLIAQNTLYGRTAANVGVASAIAFSALPFDNYENWEIAINAEASGEAIGEKETLRLIGGTATTIVKSETPAPGEVELTFNVNLGSLTLAGLDDTAIATVDDEEILMVVGGLWVNVAQSSLSIPAASVGSGQFPFDRLPSIAQNTFYGRTAAGTGIPSAVAFASLPFDDYQNWEVAINEEATGESVGSTQTLRLIGGTAVTIAKSGDPAPGEVELTITAESGVTTLAGMSDTSINPAAPAEDEVLGRASGMTTWAPVNASTLSGLPAHGTAGNVLRSTGSAWASAVLQFGDLGGAFWMEDLTDVTVGTYANHDLLQYNIPGNVWLNVPRVSLANLPALSQNQLLGRTASGSGDPAAIAFSALPFDNYQNWQLGTNEDTSGEAVGSTQLVRLIEGTNVTITRSGRDVTINASGGGGGGALNDLSDVTISTPLDGHILIYNDGAWGNELQSSLSLPAASITSGAFAKTRQHASTAYLDAAQTFVGNQDVTGTLTVTGDGTFGGLYKSSARELKDGIRDWPVDTTWLRALRPREWEWKETGGEGVGFVADEVPRELGATPAGYSHDRVFTALVAGWQDHDCRLARLEKLAQGGGP